MLHFQKSAAAYYDEAAVREPARDWGPRNRGRGKYTSDVLGAAETLADGRTHRGLTDGNFAARGRNRRSVWTIPTQPTTERHFAAYPEALCAVCIRAGSREGDLVFDPFSGTGRTGIAALKLGRRYVGCDLNLDYLRRSVPKLAEADHAGRTRQLEIAL